MPATPPRSLLKLVRQPFACLLLVAAAASRSTGVPPAHARDTGVTPVLLSQAAGASAPADAGPRPIGAVVAVERSREGIAIRCAGGDSLKVSVLAPDLIRVQARFAGQRERIDHSWAVAKADWPGCPWTLEEGPSSVVLSTSEVKVVVGRHPLLIEFQDALTGRRINADQSPMARDPATGLLSVAKALGLDEHFYGLGEKAARLDRRRGEFEMWNSDTPGYVEGTDPIYQSVPFYLGWEDGRSYGLFYDNSFRSRFDLGHSGQEAARYDAEGGELNYYFFYGPSMKKVIGRYTELTGRMPMPPLWALGNQQCRYSYYPDSMVEAIAADYRRYNLPLDVLYLDIHYMDGYRVFTWNPQRFPDPGALLGRLAAQGVKVVTIIDPGVKYQPETPGYRVFDEGVSKGYFLRRRDGRLYVGEVWPGKSVFVDYTRTEARAWWGGLHAALVGKGVAGIWDDMNEPSDFVDKSGASQQDVVFDDLGQKTSYSRNRNVFALNETRATYEGLLKLQPDHRPFIVTRAGYAGVQRYATMWTGDNNATFDSLALNLPMFASLGLSGEAFVGSDLPGFIGRGDGELLARAYEVALLVPLCRNHGSLDQYDHEPWRYGPVYADIVRKYLDLRYRLLPYLYTTLEEAHRTGVPLFRPLILEFQDDPNAVNLDDEFMAGGALLSAPVLLRGERGREVYLPRGLWYDYWTGRSVEGGNLIRVEAPLDYLPLFVRGGSILPSTVPMRHVGEKPWNPVRFDIFPDGSGAASGSLYEDDGLTPAYERGLYRRTRLTLDSSGVLSVSAAEGAFRAPPRQLQFVIHGPSGSAQSATLRDDGRAHDITFSKAPQ